MEIIKEKGGRKMPINYTFEQKKQLFKKVEQVHYLTLEIAKLIHRFSTSEEIIKEVLTPQFSAAFKQDIAKTARMCRRGNVHPYIEMLKKGWVPFISHEVLSDICFRNRGAFIDTDYLVSGESNINFSELTFLGKLNFVVETISEKESKEKLYGWHESNKYQQCGYMGFGQENSKHPADFGIPYIIMLLLHYIDYSEELCGEYSVIKEFRDLKADCMEAGEPLFDKKKQEIVNFEDNAWNTSIHTSIELPGRLVEVEPDYWNADLLNDKPSHILENSFVFVGEFIGMNASNKKKLEEVESYFLTFDFAPQEIIALELEINSAIKELQEIRQLMAGFFELYKNQILIASI
jgi:hypothetical protein